MSKAKKQKNGNKHRALSAQQTIPYIAMHPDGICQLPGGLYTKTLEYEDINYAVASTEDQTAIISGWSACLNYFDSSLPFQLSFVNRRSRNANRYKVNIPAQEDDFNSIRGEYVEMIVKAKNKYMAFILPPIIMYVLDYLTQTAAQTYSVTMALQPMVARATSFVITIENIAIIFGALLAIDIVCLFIGNRRNRDVI